MREGPDPAVVPGEEDGIYTQIHRTGDPAGRSQNRPCGSETGMPRTVGSQQQPEGARKDSFLETPKGTQVADTLIREFQPPGL